MIQITGHYNVSPMLSTMGAIPSRPIKGSAVQICRGVGDPGTLVMMRLNTDSPFGHPEPGISFNAKEAGSEGPAG